MKKAVLTYGLISGAIAVAVMMATIPFLESSSYRRAEILGYTALVVSALVVFFGIRSYRERTGGGRLSFGRGLAVGAGIALVSSLCYVVAFELASFVFIPGLGQKYAACMVRQARAQGAEAEKLRQVEAQAAMLASMMSRPLTLAAVTFAESFPLGFVVSLVSAAILRRRSPANG